MFLLIVINIRFASGIVRIQRGQDTEREETVRSHHQTLSQYQDQLEVDDCYPQAWRHTQVLFLTITVANVIILAK